MGEKVAYFGGVAGSKMGLAILSVRVVSAMARRSVPSGHEQKKNGRGKRIPATGNLRKATASGASIRGAVRRPGSKRIDWKEYLLGRLMAEGYAEDEARDLVRIADAG
jgi:hypothetical protein